MDVIETVNLSMSAKGLSLSSAAHRCRCADIALTRYRAPGGR